MLHLTRTSLHGRKISSHGTVVVKNTQAIYKMHVHPCTVNQQTSLLTKGVSTVQYRVEQCLIQ